ncbi:MAG: hypothetical protein GY928_08090 [Colwellia sp.]|nr:hypothetical protein [Colwellia sp.]
MKERKVVELTIRELCLDNMNLAYIDTSKHWEELKQVRAELEIYDLDFTEQTEIYDYIRENCSKKAEDTDKKYYEALK